MTKINFKNKTKTTTAIMATMAIGLMLSSIVTILPLAGADMQTGNGQSSNQISSTCKVKINNDIRAKGIASSNVTAISLASGNLEFQQKTVNYKTQSDSIFNSFDLDKNTCTATLTDVNVVYMLYDSSGNYKKTVIVTEDPALTKITKISEQVAKGHYGSQNYWSGYEFYGNSGQTATIYGTDDSWYLPSVQSPVNSKYAPNACRTDLGNPACDAAVWDGITDHAGGGYYIAQAGTDGNTTCNSSTCTTKYAGWYEFTPSSPVWLTLTVTPGDSMESVVENEAAYGHSSSLYDVTVTDWSTSKSQGITGYSYSLTTPKYGDFIMEREQGPLLTLNKFAQTYPGGSVYIFGSGWTTIYGLYQNTYDIQDTMKNGCTNNNITLGSVTSTSTFSELYYDSCGT